jgi:hypothetical protein
MAKGLWRIDNKEIGLRGFVRDLGRELEYTLTNTFKEKLESRINVVFNSDKHDTYFTLSWTYRGSQYNFYGEFSIGDEEENNQELRISRFPRIGIYSNSNWAEPKASSQELLVVVDIENAMVEFLKTKFGNPIGKSGNGCPLYRIGLPEKYRKLEQIIA